MGRKPTLARITIVTPARPGTRTGNLHTAQRYARFLRGEGHHVSVALEWDGKPCDLLIALHARRSSESVFHFKKDFPGKPLVVVLTGTDLYRDLPASREAGRSLELADRVIVLQEDARGKLPAGLKGKTRVVYQSSNASLRHDPPPGRFRVAVVGHLREEKDPFRAARALSQLRSLHELEVVQVGRALTPGMAAEARRWQKRDGRYCWLGSVPHAQALAWIARSHVLVVSSVMEGGANVICEAARIGTPVLASRVSGNVGMLGRDYPGMFPLFNEKILALQIRKAFQDKNYYQRLKRRFAKRRLLFAPGAERDALNRVVREALELRA
jgi:putative glycosyltransferase (TIGR04348 family)